MMSDNYNSEKLFDRARELPTELSQQKVEQMIKGFVNAPLKPPIKKGWRNYFNLNTLIMLAVPIAIALGLMAYNGTNTSSSSIVGLDPVLTKDAPIIETTTDEKLVELPTLKLPEAVDLKTTLDERAKIQIAEAPDKLDLVPIATTINTIPPADKTIVFTIDKPKSDSTAKKRQGVTVVVPKVEAVPDPLPELGGHYMRKLKRQLYKNLIADGFISYKGEVVEMELLGGEIIVNGSKINESLFIKYSNLTRKIGTGPNRKIMMEYLFFKAGDFDSEGNFKGSGIGTFVNHPDDEAENELFEKMEQDELMQMEQNELDLFSEQMRSKNEGKVGSGLFFNVNINYKDIRMLFDKLHQILVEDGLIISKSDYVLVELPKNEIRVNQKVLEGDLAVKYAELFVKYKIKRGAIRQIRLSEHTIQVGDFKPGSFTGTSATFE